ncbi:MAG: hypothetical protein RIQ53_4622 [Pseudomonadota bacterium]
MTRFAPTDPRRTVVRGLAAALAALQLAGCAGGPGGLSAAETRAQSNPLDRAQVTQTNFTPALRCMDELMFELGTRDVTLMMEELRDATQRVPVSGRDMMTSALADMTRRSRAVQLSAFGADQANLAQLLQQAQKTQPFAVVPEFSVRGAISQIDEDVRRQSSSFGVLAATFGLRLGNETRLSVLGFDAAMVRTDTFIVVPGVASKNTTVITRQDNSAGDGQGRILNTGTVFAFSAGRTEGTAQAARNMVELAAVELVGKLIRAPYWQCLGVADSQSGVQRELEDWFLSMDEGERTVFIKERLRARRWFDGALDDSASPAYTQAVAAYRRAQGLPAAGDTDLEFFKRLITERTAPGPLAAPARRARARVAATETSAEASTGASTGATAPTVASAAATSGAGTAPEPGAAAAPPPIARLQLTRRAAGTGREELQVQSDADGYVYCYAQDPATREVRRIFPNRFVRDPRISAGRRLSVPGKGRFRLPAQQALACLHAPTEVYGDLPAALRWGDFDTVRLNSFEQIQQAFAQASGQNVAIALAPGR